ncbi:ArgS-related anticodon-binding protein NrtL [Streptomyces sp. NPDC051135]|uniref:ArgS-related anticodon-binding protein NrtL n=1 Tax=unclassified Streptomyces TaxID=2593676 RepID=UPI0034267B3A
MTPVELSRTVLHAVRRAVDAGELSVVVPSRAVVAPPGPGGCGDYATNIALQLARPAGQAPLRVAEVLRPYLAGADGVTDVVLTGPGFLNISLDGAASAARLVGEILNQGTRYGYAQSGYAQSAHGDDGPDGHRARIVQLHCPRDLRAVVVAEVSARLLRSQGAPVRVTAEGFDPAWTTTLGVRVDAVGTARAGSPVKVRPVRASAPAESPVNVRPVPAPAPAELPVNVRPVPVPASASAELLALGRDAGRWALLHPAAHDRPRTGGEHLVQREGNPLFRVRYAHARTRAAVRNAADLGFTAQAGPLADAAPELLAVLADHPRVLAAAADHRAPDRLARHLVAVADAALPFLLTVLPRGGEKPSAAHRARLALAEAVGAVLAGGLSLLGIDAPDHL